MTEDEQDLAKCVYNIAYEIGIRLQFAVEGVAAVKTSDANLSRDEIARFFHEGSGLLDVVQEIPLPAVVHSLLGLFEQLVPVSPREILLRVAKAVQVGAAAGYQFESLAADLAVKLVQGYLADYRRLLQEDADCRVALAQILNTFVRAGWPAAMGLTFQLEKIFR